jgi:uncharacterized membrane protein
MDSAEKDALRQDDRNWKAGIFYLSTKDPAFLVPKRWGHGWTINFGSFWTWLLALAVIAVVVAAAVLG